MKAKSHHNTSKPSYTDEQIMEGIRIGGTSDQLVIRAFFSQARSYALAYLQPKYPKLQDEEWDVIFANTNLKLVTRIKNGWKKRGEVKLTTYYTSVAGYSVLDYLQERKQKDSFSLDEVMLDMPEPSRVQRKLESEERKEHIQAWLEKMVGNSEQVNILLLHAEGYSYKEMLDYTTYKSEGACRNAFVKGKRKVAEFLMEHPHTAAVLKKLLQEDSGEKS
mgnify:FL=1